MEKQVLIIEARREGYSTKQVYNTMTVGELKEYLDQFEDDVPVYLSHDNGYTYGGIHANDFMDDWVNDEKEEDEL